MMILMCQCPKFRTDDCNRDCPQRKEMRNDAPAVIIKGDSLAITERAKELFHKLRDELGLPNEEEPSE